MCARPLPPPPVVVLRAELEVAPARIMNKAWVCACHKSTGSAHDDGDLGAGDDQDHEDNEEEAKDVVHLSGDRPSHSTPN